MKYIIITYVLAVLLFALYFAAKEYTKESKLIGEKDFIHFAIEKKDSQIKAMGIPFTVDRYLKLLLIAPVISGAMFYYLTENEFVSVMVVIVSCFLPEGVIHLLKYDSNKKFEERYARSLEQLSSSLRAGMSISQAVEDVAECKFLHPSMRKKYAKLSSDMRMGIPVKEAFNRFAEGTDSIDAKDVAIAIDVQSEVGGHEAEVVEEIAKNIRDRIMLRREIKSIFSSTSSMIWIMDFIPPIVIIWFGATNEEYINVYFSDPLYSILLVIMIIMMAIGSIINHRTIKKVTKGE